MSPIALLSAGKGRHAGSISLRIQKLIKAPSRVRGRLCAGMSKAKVVGAPQRCRDMIERKVGSDFGLSLAMTILRSCRHLSHLTATSRIVSLVKAQHGV